MRTIVAGSRSLDSLEAKERIFQKLDTIYTTPFGDHVLLSGNAVGVDRFGEQYARSKGIDLEIYPANWARYGKAAGVVRNQKMVELADRLVVFWDGQSTGTSDVILRAEREGLEVILTKIDIE